MLVVSNRSTIRWQEAGSYNEGIIAHAYQTRPVSASRGRPIKDKLGWGGLRNLFRSDMQHHLRTTNTVLEGKYTWFSLLRDPRGVPWSTRDIMPTVFD